MKTSVYAIGDLHLSGAVDKPMDVLENTGKAIGTGSGRIGQNR